MSFRDLITRNLIWKLGSFFLALLLWYVIHPATEDKQDQDKPLVPMSDTRRFRVPITLRTAAADHGAFRIRPNEVEVTLRGDRQAIEALELSQIDASINLINIAEARDLHTRVDVRAPSGFTVVNVQPAEVSVERAELAPKP